MSDIVERLLLLAAVDNCQASIEAADTITRLTAENERLRAVLETVMIGGNHLVSIIGATHPQTGPHYEAALQFYGPGHKYEAWCCWNAIMEARAELSGDKHE
jgi:hypothetical protein